MDAKRTSFRARAVRRPVRPRALLALASDERLVEEISRGSERAFEAVYERHAGVLLSFCRHMLGSREEGEEALQHVFAAAWADLQRRDRPLPERLAPWLFAVARNRCLSMLRERGPEELELHELPSMAGLSEEVARRSELRALLADLRSLPEKQRAALLLSELSGLSHAHIADVLGCSEAHVKGFVFRARTTLIDWRNAREGSCHEFREQIAVARAGALRRKSLRRHLEACPGCREFHRQVKAQRAALGLILPVIPSAGLKTAALTGAGEAAAVGGSAAAGGGAAGVAAGLTGVAIPSVGAFSVAPLAVIGAVAASALTAGVLPVGVHDRGSGSSVAENTAIRPTGLPRVPSGALRPIRLVPSGRDAHEDGALKPQAAPAPPLLAKDSRQAGEPDDSPDTDQGEARGATPSRSDPSTGTAGEAQSDDKDTIKPKKSEKDEKPQRDETQEKDGKQEKSETDEKSEKPPKSEKAPKSEKPPKPEKPSKSGRPLSRRSPRSRRDAEKHSRTPLP